MALRFSVARDMRSEPVASSQEQTELERIIDALDCERVGGGFGDP